MEKIVLTVDSGMSANIKDDSVEIPARIVSGDGAEYIDDGKSITSKEIIDKTKEGIYFKTSAPVVGDYYNAFSSILEEGKDIIHLSMSSGISSGSVLTSNMVANELNEDYENKVYVIDSLTGSIGGSLYYELAYNKLINSNLSTEELVEELKNLRSSIFTSFYVPEPSGFLRSGRDKSSSHLKDHAKKITSNMLKMTAIKFRVDFHESGDLFPKALYKGGTKSAFMKMLKDLINDDNITNYDDYIVMIGNLLPKNVDLEEVKDYIESFNYFKNIKKNKMGNVVAPYGSEDLCGVALIKKK